MSLVIALLLLPLSGESVGGGSMKQHTGPRAQVRFSDSDSDQFCVDFKEFCCASHMSCSSSAAQF